PRIHKLMNYPKNGTKLQQKMVKEKEYHFDEGFNLQLRSTGLMVMCIYHADIPNIA
ncbi:hypothetical protein HK099_002861, partial [Clydaea vesicula]